MSSVERVIAAISGGVDSAVAALLAQRQGLEVVGLTLRMSDDCAEAGRAVCEELGIEHHVVDVTEEFEERVVRPFVEEYALGSTPNPCVICNPTVKFDALTREADRLGCGRVLTGHYARVQRGEAGSVLARGVDPRKDQSYMLYRLAPATLDRLLLPLGEMTKTEVRALAVEAGFTAVDRPESQDACFIPDGDVAGFVGERHPEAIVPGEIVDRKGAVVGEHSGLAGYTVGQRRGLGLGGADGPFFVLAIDAAKNRLVVGPEEALWVNQCHLEDLVLRGVDAAEPFEVEVVTRLRGLITPATVTIDGDLGHVEFERAHRAPTPGQAAVFYRDDRVIGGGTIIPPKEARRRKNASREQSPGGPS
jgi:tRNA-specific 2-thiouridylase